MGLMVSLLNTSRDYNTHWLYMNWIILKSYYFRENYTNLNIHRSTPSPHPHQYNSSTLHRADNRPDKHSNSSGAAKCLNFNLAPPQNYHHNLSAASFNSCNCEAVNSAAVNGGCHSCWAAKAACSYQYNGEQHNDSFNTRFGYILLFA